MSGEIELNIGSLKPDGSETPVPVGTQVHFQSDGQPTVNKSFSADPTEDAEAAAAAAAKPVPVALPEGVTQAQMDALKAAGYTVGAPAPTVPVAPATPTDPTATPSTPAVPTDGVFSIEAFNKYASEFQKNDGTLSEASRTQIMKDHNIDAPILDAIMRGVQAEATVTAEGALKEVGSTMEDFNSWSAWSLTNETNEVRESRLTGLTSLDSTTRGLALQSLRDAHKKATAGEPDPLRGGGAPDPMRSQGFQERLEVYMEDPRYHRKDAVGDAFRARVYAELEGIK